MSNSGKKFDYRNSPILNHRKLVRRYPTGAVSEKIALIMPSLLMCFSELLPLASPFLVAKSLSFTGGTWDKLSSIRGFSFPDQGIESINCLKEINVSMTVTKGDFNPADRILYQMRSLTNTVNSIPLIISSIASKQISNPVDSLILDIRYGENAFLKNIEEAKHFSAETERICNHFGIKCKSINTSTNDMFGSSIGNYWEVLESLAIMTNSNSFSNMDFTNKILSKQKAMVILMTVELINLEFGIDKKEIEKKCDEYFNTGSVFNAFLKLIKSHGVQDNIINQLKSRILEKPTTIFMYELKAYKKGVIKKLDKKNLEIW